MNNRRLPAVLGAGLLALALTACGGGGGSTTSSGAKLVNSGTLTVCSDVPYPPFEDFDKSAPTGFKGFDVDIVSQIAKGLNLKLTIKDSSFDALQSGLALNSGQCDLAASAMTITADRKKNLDFSDGYYNSKQSLLVPDGSSIKTIDDLSGKKVGVQQGTTGKTYTEDNAPSDAQIVTFPSDAEMYQAIKAGQVDALLQDLPVNLNHQQAGGYQIVQTYDTNEQYGLAMKKGNTHLVDDVDKQLQKMHDDGTYDTLYNKYFSTK
ncbi:ABC transporter substrate-binding protein [Nocardioides panaciterrulae]|uniref:Polar amino acid transport system substrate-binding protein n=1 Tax=Nocardioides panaciterrulae TaxID=661492 RepID=A0A7Y9JA33_9ACTN|nr:ABC transporter substrate-binding protein [Nocardioides panaciterrulae]NYD41257.1 polar amino acid transport system substrate-binding protein [Nocardioides panaciterrulae]